MLPTIKKILYATDLSEHARYAFSYAAVMANKFDARITLLHVIEDVSDSSMSMIEQYIGKDEWKRLRKEREEDYRQTIQARLKTFYEEMRTELADCPFLVERYILRQGNPATVILEKSKDDYDVVIMGSHGHGLFAGALMGNTARQVIRRCKKPVMVIRIPEDD